MNVRSTIRSSFTALCIIILILDNRTGISGAAEGIDLCLKTLIPSLFPFFVLSILLTDALLGQPLSFLQPIAKLCRLPPGSESLLAIGFLGGYPVGAQNVSFAYKQGVLSPTDAQRMVVFCNNAGPAFIFGFLGQIFQNPFYPWLLWFIHILSALIVGSVIPGGDKRTVAVWKSTNITVPAALDKSIRIMAQVCGWVILFRILLQFLQKWICFFFSVTVQILVAGLLELTNGCILLQCLPSDGLKFILSSLMLGFGGICVSLQTYSISGDLSLHLYLPGKILHGCVGFLISYVVQFTFFPNARYMISPVLLVWILLLTVLTAVLLRNIEKPVAFSNKILYNKKSCEKRRILCCSERKLKNPASTVPTVPN